MDAILGKAKAIVGLVASVLTALLVSFPDSPQLKVVAGVVGALVSALAVYAVPNKPVE